MGILCCRIAFWKERNGLQQQEVSVRRRSFGFQRPQRPQGHYRAQLDTRLGRSYGRYVLGSSCATDPVPVSDASLSLAAGVSVIAFALSLSTHIGVTLLASLFSFLAFLVTLAALIIDLALLGFVRSQVNGLDHSEFATKVAPALWMTLASLGLLFLSGCIVCCGRRARGKTFKAVELKPDSVVEQGPDHETNNENFWVKCLRRRAKH